MPSCSSRRHKCDALVAAALLSSALTIAIGPASSQSEGIPKKGTTPYGTHFIFRPVTVRHPRSWERNASRGRWNDPELKGERMLDKMSARCNALNVVSGEKKYIDGACVLADTDGDMIFSTFDTRDVDKTQPEMNCGTHIITGGTGKYKGITGREPFACNPLPALAGPGGYTAMTIPHNTSWEIK